MFMYQKKFLNLSLLFLMKFSVGLTALRWWLLWLFPESLAASFASQSIHAFSLALLHTASISYIHEHYRNRQLSQQFYLGISYGLGGFFGSLLAGWVYGEYLFFWMGLVALGGFAVLFMNGKQLKTVSQSNGS